MIKICYQVKMTPFSSPTIKNETLIKHGLKTMSTADKKALQIKINTNNYLATKDTLSYNYPDVSALPIDQKNIRKPYLNDQACATFTEYL